MGRVTVWMFAALFAVGFAAAQEPQPNALFLDGDIEIEVQASGEVVVSWRTLSPTLPGTVYFGLVPDGAEIAVPRYRRYARAEGDTREMAMAFRAQFSLSRYETELYDIAELRENRGGTVYVRLEVWNPGWLPTSRLFHTRFAYARDDEGNARRVPCIVLGPFVDNVTEDSAVISWETDLSVRCSFARCFGDGSLVTEVRTGFVRQDLSPGPWEREIYGLAPDTEVTYRVVLEDSATGERLPSSSRTFTFRTAPAPGSDTPFRFAAMSDSRSGLADPLAAVEGCSWTGLRQLTQEARRQGASLMIFAGDLIGGYTASRVDFERQMRSWRRAVGPIAATIPIYPGPGNHDVLGPPPPPDTTRYIQHSHADENAPEVVFSEQFVNPTNGPGPEEIDGVEGPPYGETVYSFDWANAHFVSLNANYWWKRFNDINAEVPGNRMGNFMDGQLEWLDADLAAARERGQDHLFLYFHTPIFPNGGHLSSAMYHSGEIPEMLEMRDRFLEIMTRHDVLATFHGDEHHFCRMLVDGSVRESVSQPFWQITTGGAGAPFYGQQQTDWSDSVQAFSVQTHVVIVEVDGDDVTLRAISDTGEVLDEVSLTGALPKD